MPSTFQGHFGPRRFCASHHAWWCLLVGFDVYVPPSVPRASRAGKFSIIGLLVDSHGLQAANHKQHAGSDRSDSVLARHVVFKRRAPVARRRDTTVRGSSRAATASAMLARLCVQVHTLTVDLARISHNFFCATRCSHLASGRYFFQSLASDNLASVHGDLWQNYTVSSKVVCFAAFFGIFPTPSTWTLSPSRADAGVIPAVGPPGGGASAQALAH